MDNLLTKEDQDFINSIYQDLKEFVESGEEMLEFQPMNSYQRRLVHKLVANFRLKSHSVGEEERFVCVVRTDDSLVPEMEIDPSQPVYDYGMQTYFTAPATRIVLRSDGSFGIPLKSERFALLDERMVERAFRIRKNKIVCHGEKGW